MFFFCIKICYTYIAMRQAIKNIIKKIVLLNFFTLGVMNFGMEKSSDNLLDNKITIENQTVKITEITKKDYSQYSYEEIQKEIHKKLDQCLQFRKEWQIDNRNLFAEINGNNPEENFYYYKKLNELTKQCQDLSLSAKKDIKTISNEIKTNDFMDPMMIHNFKNLFSSIKSITALYQQLKEHEKTLVTLLKKINIYSQEDKDSNYFKKQIQIKKICEEIHSMSLICLEKDVENNKERHNNLVTKILSNFLNGLNIAPEENKPLSITKNGIEDYLSSLTDNLKDILDELRQFADIYFKFTDQCKDCFIQNNINEDISKIKDLQNTIQLTLSESKSIADKNILIQIKKLVEQNVVLQKYKKKLQFLINKNGKINVTEWDTKIKNILNLFTFDSKEQLIWNKSSVFLKTRKDSINQYSVNIKTIIPYIQQIINFEIEINKQLKQLYREEKQNKQEYGSVINPSEFNDDIDSTFDMTEMQNLDFDDILKDIKLIKKTADVDILSSTSLNVEDETPAENNRLNNRIGKFACNVNHIQEKAEDIHATNFGLYIKNNSNKELSELPKGGNEKKTIEELAQDRDFIINKKPSSHNDQVNKLTGERTLGHCTTSSDQQKVMGQDVRQKQNKSERIRAIQHQKKHQEEVKKEKETIGQKRQSNNQIFEIIEASVMEEKQNVIKAKEMIGSKNNKDKKNYKK